MRILMIDDSRMIRLVHERALANAGYEVIGASDGEDGLRMAHEWKPDLIVLDLLLPKLAGQDVLRCLKQDLETRDIPVVVLTGLSRNNAAKLANEGAADFVEKKADRAEVDPQTLVKAVRRVLSSQSRFRIACADA